MTMQRMYRTPLVVTAALLLAAGILSGQQSVFTPGGTLPLLDAYLEPLRQQAGIPGMSAAVLSDGELVWEKGYGFQNIATRERPTADTPYLVGDMSSTLAAVLLLQCVEQRRAGPGRAVLALRAGGSRTRRDASRHSESCAARVRARAVHLQP